MNPLFEKFFSVGNIKVGPTIISPFNVDGDILGSIQIYSTNKDFFLEKKVTGVVIRELNNIITEELYSALKYLSIDKSQFDYFINQLYIFEWESAPNPKPNLDRLKNRAYIYEKFGF